MTRQLAVLAVAAICLSGLTTAKSVDVVPKAEDLAEYQKKIEFFLVPSYEVVNPEIKAYSEKFTYDECLERYTKKEVVKEFWKLYEHGLLPPDHIFSIFEHEHLQQAIALFKLFYYAPNFDSFMQAASWARIHLNEELFFYSFSVAILHRSETKYLLVPPMFQVEPNFFFRSDFVLEFYKRLLGFYQGHGDTKSMREPIWANYTYTYAAGTRDPETRLTYLYEDVGFNTCYYYLHIIHPFWMSSIEFPFVKDRGFVYYSIHKWIINRIEMERYSFGMKQIEFIDLHRPIQTGYTPSMMHSNGIMFPQRKEWTNVLEYNYNNVEAFLNFETRIKDGIDSRHFLYKEGTSVKKVPFNGSYEDYNRLGDILAGAADSMNLDYYGSVEQLGRKILGFGLERKDEHHIVPGALEHFITSLRDPAFYRLYSKFLSYFYEMEKLTPPRPKEEVASPYSIKSVNVGEISTIFETFDFVVRNISQPNHPPFIIKARQTRLNFKNFDLDFVIKGVEISKMVISIFLGPPLEVDGQFIRDPVKIYPKLTHDYMNKFYLFDRFVHDVVVGENKITRNTKDSTVGVFDFHSYPYLDYKKLDSEVGFGFPRNILVPKGTCEGLPAMLYIHIGKHDDTTKPLTFPLDREMVTYEGYPNVALHPIVIYHKDESHINLTV